MTPGAVRAVRANPVGGACRCCTTNASLDRRRLVMRGMTQDAF